MESVEMTLILKKFDDLFKLINEKNWTPKKQRQPKNELYAALAKAKLEYKNVRFNRQNSFNKQVYCDLDAIQKATNNALANQGLVLVQEPKDINGTTFLISVLGHSSGQEIRCKNRPFIPASTGAKSDLQRLGESMAYLKRQVAQSMLGIVANNDPEDNDDENLAEMMYNNEVRRSVAGDERVAYVDQGILSERITKDQLTELNYELQEYPIMTASLKKMLNISDLSDMPKARFTEEINRIRKHKISLREQPKKEW